MKLVIDASVILKIALTENEQDQQVALDLAHNFENDKVEIILPNFWTFEVGNILIRKTEDFERVFRSLLKTGFRTYNFNEDDLVEIGKLAKNYKVSYYDASYHFLAKLTNSTLITADEKYFEKTKGIGNIALLKYFKI